MSALHNLMIVTVFCYWLGRNLRHSIIRLASRLDLNIALTDPIHLNLYLFIDHFIKCPNENYNFKSRFLQSFETINISSHLKLHISP